MMSSRSVFNIWCLISLYLLNNIRYSVASSKYTKEDIVSSNSVDEPTSLTDEDFSDLDSFKEANLSDILDPEEVSGDPTLRANKFEGDILDHSSVEILEFITNSNRLGRNAVKSRWQHWSGGRIPYLISSRYGPYSRKVIAKAFKEYEERTCIRFVPRKAEYDYIYISPKDGCYSLVGKVGGRQPVSLDSGCIQVGTIIHELMHVVGFFHEQSRNDRDDYIDIIDKNIIPGARDQFEKYSLRTITHLGVSYDYGSIMHYGPYAFSRKPWRADGKTIIARKSGGHLMGQRKDFSSKDLKKINKLYQCSEDKIGSKTGTDDEDEDEDSSTVGIKPRPRPQPGQPGRCRDTGSLCGLRSLLFSCQSSRSMRRDCRQTCGLCGRSSRRRGGDSDSDDDGDFKIVDLEKIAEKLGMNSIIFTSTWNSDMECQDHGNKCKKWKKKGYCDTRNDYMTEKCPKSCGKCSPGSIIERSSGRSLEKSSSPGECKDINKHCNDWITEDENRCQKLKQYMTKVCRESCNAC